MFGLCVIRIVFFALVGRLGQHVAQCFRPPVVLVRRHDETAFGQIDSPLDVLEARQHRGLVGAIELAGINPSNGYTG